MSKDVHGDIEARLKSANGLVLDLGPGTGEMLSRMGTERITKIYGAEPAVDMHATLRANVAKISGLDGKYEVLACGAEPESLVPALDKAGLISSSSASDGVFDTILCIRVLCGVPRQQETIEGLYRLLKPGGRMIIYEHVVSPWPAKGSSVLGYILQKVWYLAGWNLMMGGCEINRDTVSALTKAGAAQGGWKKVDLKYWDAWNAAPWIVGELVKA
ncbi:S-adenosyl-L-methionine-dependent methyltransferase [Xylariales sp. PMI_506]|nr:S-adenosyl-L-methionine-dependent methyltransferase [Xylariales sp. PMI_506]